MPRRRGGPEVERTPSSQADKADKRVRAELGGSERAQRDAAVGPLEHEQDLGDEREPVADLRDELAAEEQAEVPDVQ
jgi:hypothetical protein